jgi:hypothetical protein
MNEFGKFESNAVIWCESTGMVVRKSWRGADVKRENVCQRKSYSAHE